MTKEFKITGPGEYLTYGGDKAIILSKNPMPDHYEWVGIYGTGNLLFWGEDGVAWHTYEGEQEKQRIIGVWNPSPVIEAWLSICPDAECYDFSRICAHTTKEEAEDEAGLSTVSIRKIRYENGKIIDVTEEG